MSLTTTPAVSLLYPKVAGDFGSLPNPYNNHAIGGGVIETLNLKISPGPNGIPNPEWISIPFPLELDVGVELGILSFPGILKDSNLNNTGMLNAPLRIHLLFGGIFSIGGGIYWSHLYGAVPADTFRRIDDFGIAYGGQIAPFPTAFISPVIDYRYLYGLLTLPATGSARFRGQEYTIGIRIGSVSP